MSTIQCPDVLLHCPKCDYIASEAGFYLVDDGGEGTIGYHYRCPECGNEEMEDASLS